ncbi:MAG: pyrrolo-quinoline quinone [Deltaproteobacteria bacterium]|nr:pyrrolo-quinoline quinone [Deltaproteobacteria bacterium]
MAPRDLRSRVRLLRRRRAAAGALLLAAFATGCSDSAPRSDPARLAAARDRAAAPEREWRSYLGDVASRQWSPLAQIDRDNVTELEVAWTYHSGASDTRGVQIQFNPLVVKGVLYGSSPGLVLFALDAVTGEELWRFDPGIKAWAANPSRGATYWAEGDDERIFFGAGNFLFAVDARSGRKISSFGDGGRIDLREGLGRPIGDDMMGVIATTPGTIFEDLLLMGGRVNEMEGAAPGHVRAFDARTGEIRWIFHTIPQPGELGYGTWPEEAWRSAGGANSWAGITVDPVRGLAFVPTGSATPDFYGAERPGDNLFANCLIALDARTGQYVWHQQIVRHDLWDRDLPSPPNLVEVERDGVRVAAVAQTTKTGDTFVFGRETGEPLFALREEPVASGAVFGEVPAASQPLPVRPEPFVRQEFSAELVSDRTPEIEATMRERVAKMRSGSLFIPPSVEGTVLYPGTDGGAEWGGAAWDASTGILYVNANQVASILQVVESAGEVDVAGSAYLLLCAGCHGLDLRGDGVTVPSLIGVEERMGFLDFHRILRNGRGRMPPVSSMLEWWQALGMAWMLYGLDEADAPSAWSQGEGPRTFANAGYRNLRDVDGLPGTKPPWGTLTAIDLNSGEHRWQIPFGDYPEILEAGQSGLGAESYGGPVVTAGGLLFIAATPDAKIRAFDKQTGALLWQDGLPHAAHATPAVYEAGGRQFVVVPAGGGKFGQASGDVYVAYALAE